MRKLIKFLNIFLILIVIVMLNGCSKKQSTSDVELNIGQIRQFYDAENNTTEVSYEIEIKNNSLYNIELNIIFEIMAGYNKRTEKTIAYPINTKQCIYETSAFTLDGDFYNINYRIDDYKYDSLLGTYKYWLISILAMTILLVAIYWITVTKREIEFKKVKNFFKKHFWIFFFFIIPFIPCFVLSGINSAWSGIPVAIIIFGILITILMTLFVHRSRTPKTTSIVQNSDINTENHINNPNTNDEIIFEDTDTKASEILASAAIEKPGEIAQKKQDAKIEKIQKTTIEVPKFKIMLPRTKTFLLKVHQILVDLGYDFNTFPLKYSDIENCAIQTLNHTKNLNDAKLAVKYFSFIREKYDKICSKVERHYDFWKTIIQRKQRLISLASDEEAEGVFFITNAFHSNYNKVSFCGHSLGENIFFDISYAGGKFYLGDKDNYSYGLRFGFSSEKMILFDENKNKLCDLIFDGYNIFLTNNKTNYEIINDDYGMMIYKKSYIASHRDKCDAGEMLAFIDWDIFSEENDKFLKWSVNNFVTSDIIKEKNEYGVAMLVDCSDEDSDLEMFVMFAMSGFLMYHRKMQEQRNLAAFIAFNNYNMMKKWWK